MQRKRYTFIIRPYYQVSAEKWFFFIELFIENKHWQHRPLHSRYLLLITLGIVLYYCH